MVKMATQEDNVGSENESCSGEGAGDVSSALLNLSSKLKPDPELDNFLQQVDEISLLIKGLASNDPKENEKALRKADILLHEKNLGDIDDPEKVQCQVTQDKSQINKIPDKEEGSGDMGQDAFMRMVEQDAKQRAADRKLRKKDSDALRKKGNIAFGKKDYAGALYNFNEAIKLIKDSPCLYNNRALTYLRLGITSAAIEDCDRALLIEDYSLRARMYKAKALFISGEAEKCRMELDLAREKLPGHLDLIKEYEEEIFLMGRQPDSDKFSDDEKVWQDSANFTGQFAISHSKAHKQEPSSQT